MNRRRTDYSPTLYVFTAATIVAGLASFVWAAASFPVDEQISLTSTGGREGILLGLVFWIAVGLLGGFKVERLHGHGVLTFHYPFIIAATALGGPVAGALVALISTVERRELRDVPWFGLLANHASLTLAAICGGVTMLLVRQGLTGLAATEAQTVGLIAIVLGSLVLATVAMALASATVILRDGLRVSEAVRVYDTGFRTTSSAEVVLGWVLWLTFSTVGWWAALICAVLVLSLWSSHDAREIARHDAMTGLLSRAGFDVRLTDALEAIQRRGQSAALLAVDLDGFKAINDKHGHAVGDDVIREVGARLRASIRLTDSAVRRGGDEFGVLLADMPDRETARELSIRIHEAICGPIAVDGRTIRIGASIGVVFIEPTTRPPSIGRLHDLTDRLMYTAKRHGGGLRFDESWSGATRDASS
jgi:diguanylate cyclase (GGDEF)-like protein